MSGLPTFEVTGATAAMLRWVRVVSWATFDLIPFI
jgi:hypothetical protein